MRIPAAARQIFRDLGEERTRFPDPFSPCAPTSFRRWLAEPSSVDPGGPRFRSRLWRWVYGQRSDIQRAFPDPTGTDEAAFARWIDRHGVREYDLPVEIADGLAPEREELAREPAVRDRVG